MKHLFSFVVGLIALVFYIVAQFWAEVNPLWAIVIFSIALIVRWFEQKKENQQESN